MATAREILRQKREKTQPSSISAVELLAQKRASRDSKSLPPPQQPAAEAAVPFQTTDPSSVSDSLPIPSPEIEALGEQGSPNQQGQGVVSPPEIQKGSTDAGVSFVRSEPIPDEDIRAREREDFNTLADQQSPKKGFVAQIKQDIPQMVGSTFGGALSTKAVLAATKGGSPRAQPFRLAAAGAAGLAGAFLGGGAGELGQVAFEEATGKPPSAQDIGETPLNRFLKAGGQELAGAAIGAGVAGTLKRLFRPGIGRFMTIPGVDELSEKLKAAAKTIPKGQLNEWADNFVRTKGAFLTLAQRTDSRNLDMLESFIEHSFFGGAGLQMQKEVIQPAAFQQWAKNIVGSYWDNVGRRVPSDEASDLMLDAIRGGDKAYRDMTSALYKGVDDAVEAIGKPISETSTITSKVLDAAGDPIIQEVTEQTANIVDFKGAKRVAQQFIETVRNSKGLGSGPRMERLIEKVDSLADSGTFSQAQDFRSFILEEARLLEGEVRSKLPRVKRIATQVENELKQSMSTAAKKHSDELHNLWRTADRAAAKGFERYGNKFVKGVVRSLDNGENVLPVAKKVFVKGGQANMRKMKEILPKETYDMLRATWLEDAFKVENVQPGKALNNLFVNMTDDTMKAFSETPRHFTELKQLAETGEILGKSTGGGGGILAPLTQAAAFINLLTRPGQDVGESIVILGGPQVIGSILSREGPTKWLLKAVRDPSRTAFYTREAMKAASKLTLSDIRSRQRRRRLADRTTEDVIRSASSFRRAGAGVRSR